MNDFPLDITIGLGIVLFATLGFIVYILCIDSIEDKIDH
jgi:hypothetical protein